MVHSYYGLPHRNEKVPTTATHNTNESHRQAIARKNLDTKETMWCDSTPIKFKMIMETTTVVTRGKS